MCLGALQMLLLYVNKMSLFELPNSKKKCTIAKANPTRTKQM